MSFIIYIHRVVPESVPWLLSKGRVSDAEAVLEKAAKFNGRKLPERCLHVTSEKHLDEVTSAPLLTPIALFRTPQLRKFAFCGSLFW